MNAHTWTWATALIAWRVELVAAGMAVGTVNLRKHYLRRWGKVCPSPFDANRDTLVAWLAHPGWSPETRKSARQAVRSFYGWAWREGYMDEDPSADLPAIYVPAPQPRPADDDDVREALATARPREWLAIMLGAVGGLRRKEIAQVHVGRDLRGRWLTVHGKGGKERNVYLPRPVIDALRARGEGWAFPSPRGGHLTPGHIGKLITMRLPDGVTPHQLRHLAATDLHDRGASLLDLRVFLGHAKVSTTQIYVAVRPHRVAAFSDEAAARFA